MPILLQSYFFVVDIPILLCHLSLYQYHQYTDQRDHQKRYISCNVFSLSPWMFNQLSKTFLMQGIKCLVTFFRKKHTINEKRPRVIFMSYTYQWSACIFVWFILFIKKLHKICLFFTSSLQTYKVILWMNILQYFWLSLWLLYLCKNERSTHFAFFSWYQIFYDRDRVCHTLLNCNS